MKSILISIKPKWVAKILNEEKIIEIRKSFPKCKLPIDVYIYCTKNGQYLQECMTKPDCDTFFDSSDKIQETGEGLEFDDPLNGKVVARFTLKKVERIVSCVVKGWGEDWREMNYGLRLEDSDAPNDDSVLFEKSGEMQPKEIAKYLGFGYPTGKPDFGRCPDFKEGVTYGCAWHIDDLCYFCAYFRDMPRELSDFGLKRAPQSWCYVEVEK